MRTREHKLPTPGKVRDQPPQQLDHLNLDRSHSNATSVVVGAMDLENVLLQGA